MAEKIKGITIEFRGNTTPLQKAIRTVNSEISKTTKELTSVNKALKFNPTSVDLWRQKQDLLNQKIASTEDKLDALKQQQKQMDAANVSKNSEEYRKLEREIIETSSQLKTFKTQLREVGNVNLKALSEGFKQVGSKIENVGNSLRGVSLAAGAVVGSLAAISVKAGKAADDINTMSKVTGISTDNLQKYSYAADLVDTSVEAIAKANKKLTKSAYSAANGSKSQAAAFDAIGVSVTDANGNLRDSESIFQDVITALGKMENETERDALAQQLMGKSAAELNPLIEDQGETYRKISETLAKYDLDYLDEDTIRKAQEFNDELDTMKLIGSVAFAQVGSELSGYLAPALAKVVDYVGKFAKWLSDLDPRVLTVVGGIAAFVAVLSPLLIGLGKMAFAVSSIMSLMGTLGISIAAIAGPIGIAIAVIAAIIAAIVLWKKHGDKFKKWIADFGKKIKDVFVSIKTSITKTWNEIKAFLIKVWAGIKTAAGVAWEAIKIAALGPMYVLFNLIRTNWDSIKAFLTNTWNAIRTTATSAWNGIRTAITSPIQSAYSTLSGIWSSIRNTATSAFNSIWSTASSVWNNIRNAITSPINSAYSTVAGVLNRIRNLFPIGGGRLFSHITLPHFSWSWRKLGKYVSIPKISVDWYAKGGIFDSPTVAGLGEAGPEAVVPLDKFWDKMDAIAAASSGNGPVINIYPTPDMNVNELATKIEQILVRQQKQRSMAYGGI